MATETGGPSAAQANEEPEKPQQSKGKAKEQPAQAEGAGEKKLTNAELKKKAKEEKAARRAQAKATQPTPAPGASGQHAASAEGKGGKGKPKQDGQQAGGQNVRPPLRAASSGSVIKEMKASIPDCFSHLSMARRIEMTHSDKDVNPAVLVLGQYMSAFAISDSITRLEATLLAFKKVGPPCSFPLL